VRHVLVALGALVGFAFGFIVTFLVGINVTASPECDGMCFDKWDEVTYVGYGIGAVSAIGSALGARSLLRRRSADQDGNPS
jgi:hypothetical protein